MPPLPPTFFLSFWLQAKKGEGISHNDVWTEHITRTQKYFFGPLFLQGKCCHCRKKGVQGYIVRGPWDRPHRALIVWPSADWDCEWKGEWEKKGRLSQLPAASLNVSPGEAPSPPGRPQGWSASVWEKGEQDCVFRLEIIFIPSWWKSQGILNKGQIKCVFCTCHMGRGRESQTSHQLRHK